jgi:hypothetical protein
MSFHKYSLQRYHNIAYSVITITLDLRSALPVWTHPASYKMGNGSLSQGKAAGAWGLPPTPSSAEVKERVELYLYSPSGPSWPVLGWSLRIPLPLHLVWMYRMSSTLVTSWRWLRFTAETRSSSKANSAVSNKLVSVNVTVLNKASELRKLF